MTAIMLIAAALIFLVGIWSYRIGWRDGREDFKLRHQGENHD